MWNTRYGVKQAFFFLLLCDDALCVHAAGHRTVLVQTWLWWQDVSGVQRALLGGSRGQMLWSVITLKEPLMSCSLLRFRLGVLVCRARTLENILRVV